MLPGPKCYTPSLMGADAMLGRKYYDKQGSHFASASESCTQGEIDNLTLEVVSVF